MWRTDFGIHCSEVFLILGHCLKPQRVSSLEGKLLFHVVDGLHQVLVPFEFEVIHVHEIRIRSSELFPEMELMSIDETDKQVKLQ